MITRTTFLLALLSTVVDGSPTPQTIVPREQQETQSVARAETGALGRLVYGITAIICLCGLSFALGLRVTQFERKKQLQFAWILSHIQTVFAMMLVVSGAILIYGLNFTTWKQCRASITICISLYFSSKILLYIFYLERVHIARLPFVLKRRHDKVWVGGMIIVVGFFGGMALWCIATPHADISVEDGQCRIGSDMIPSYVGLSFDIIINICLTGVFVWLILPVLNNTSRGPLNSVEKSPQPSSRKPFALRGILSRNTANDDQLALSVRKMLKRNIIGSALTFVAAAINLIIYFVDATSQIAYVCYTLCIVDVIFGVLVVQWLTFGSNKANPEPSQHALALANHTVSSPDALDDLTLPATIHVCSKGSQ